MFLFAVFALSTALNPIWGANTGPVNRCSHALEPQLGRRVTLNGGPLKISLLDFLLGKEIEHLPVPAHEISWNPQPHFGNLPVRYIANINQWVYWLGRRPWTDSPLDIHRYIAIDNSDPELQMPGKDILAPVLNPESTFNGEVELLGDATIQSTHLILDFDSPAASYASHFRLGSSDDGSPLREEISKHVSLAFERYAEGLFSPLEVQVARKTEEKLDPTRTFVLAFTDPSTQETKMVVRLFDASPHISNRTRFRSAQLRAHNPPRLPVELTYPDLILPERRTHGEEAHIFEIGRLAASVEVEKGIRPSLNELAWYLSARYEGILPDEGAVYAVAASTQARNVYAQRFKFTLIMSPSDTPALSGDPENGIAPEYVLRMPLREFYERYSGKAPSRRTPFRTPKWR